jgi:hypothetical protein
MKKFLRKFQFRFFFFFFFLVVSLLAERAALDELGLAAGGAGEEGAAILAVDDGGGVRVDGGDVGADGALDVHEERVGALDEAGALVLLALGASGGVAEIGIKEAHFFVFCFSWKKFLLNERKDTEEENKKLSFFQKHEFF